MDQFKPIKIREQNLVSFKVFHDWSSDLDLSSIDEEKDIAIVLLSKKESFSDLEEIRDKFEPFSSVLFGYEDEKPIQKLVYSIDNEGLVNIDLADLRNLVSGGFGIIRYRDFDRLNHIEDWDRGLLDIFVGQELSIVELEEIIEDFLYLEEFVWGLKIDSVDKPKALSVMIKDWNKDTY